MGIVIAWPWLTVYKLSELEMLQRQVTSPIIVSHAGWVLETEKLIYCIGIPDPNIGEQFYDIGEW